MCSVLRSLTTVVEFWMYDWTRGSRDFIL
jgi:hypothetical protein